jgi:thymidylate synthase (FAD)
MIQTMGSDLTVVNAARVSFDKESHWDKKDNEYVLSERDTKLIRYLARHNHWTPFGHATATFRIKAPIFVARQLGKHQVGLVWNEVSRRYVDSEPEFFVPDSWRKRASDKKQGSADETTQTIQILGEKPVTLEIDHLVQNVYSHAEDIYLMLLEDGICPEQARMVLPQSMMTEWYWTGSLAAFARVCQLRLDPHTQKETRDIALDIAGHLSEAFPASWAALIGSDSPSAPDPRTTT